ncbi:hypothetical protein [Intestinibacter bartlettii]|uniref:RNA-binding S4 domain-containing protein n=1 Tax=Intestinibacter bartlettii TaxID=261299 RepID=A0ABS6E069_9FIRM|nr:hypothetical protein [Intestinibacter bartlettii]MBU5337491.1 hypothetical protein [Intestinibacter bartlettii]
MKLFEQYEIKKFLEPFEGERIKETIVNGVVKLNNATIKIGDEVFSFTGNDYNFYILLNLIKYIEIDESEEITSVKMKLDNNLNVLFYYKNI